MSRDLPSGISDNLEDDVIFPFFAVELLFDDGTFDTIDGQAADRILRLWTGNGDLSLNDDTFFGTGNLLDISAVEETVEIAARGATLTLSAVPSDVISLALTQQYQGRQAKIYFGLKKSGSTTFKEIFAGYMDQMKIEEGPETSTIQLTLENKLIDLERPRVGRFTSEYQKAAYANDKGFDFVESLQDLQLNWGRSNA